MSAKKSKDKKKKTTRVEVVNETLNVGVTAKPCLIKLFEAREITPGGNLLGPLGGLDLTGYGEYRLTLHFAGTPGTPFSIDELFGPAGSVDQVKFSVGNGEIGPQGTLNYRARFDIFGPRNLFIQINNDGIQPCQVDGTLYAVQ
ncbi:MAG: hypothetical protein WBN02_13350 [Sedimenticolaceae bacterium]